MTDNLQTQLVEVQSAVAEAAQAAGRADEVTLIAVSKTVPQERLWTAVALGQKVFGENRVQEAKAKWPEIRAAHPDLELHLIGPLQSNKARDAVALFDVIQTVDRDSVAKAIAREIDKQDRHPKLLVQVNTGREPQKAGVLPEDTPALIRKLRADCGLTISGLMCIPPAGANPSDDFRLLGQIASDEGLPLLSMGMSGDFITAIGAGATHVRVGTAIFGAR